MDDNVVRFTGNTKLDIPVERIFEGALQANLEEVVIIGFDAEGEFKIFSSSGDARRIVFALEYGKNETFEWIKTE